MFILGSASRIQIYTDYAENTSHDPEPFKQLPDDKILDWSKLERITDDILKCI